MVYSPIIETKAGDCSSRSACPRTSSRTTSNSSSVVVLPSESAKTIRPRRIKVWPLLPVAPPAAVASSTSKRSPPLSSAAATAAIVSSATSFSLASPSNEKHSSVARNSASSGTTKAASAPQSTSTDDDGDVMITSPALTVSPSSNRWTCPSEPRTNAEPSIAETVPPMSAASESAMPSSLSFSYT